MKTPKRIAAPSDAEMMRRALALAERGWGQTAPNPMVGAVVVRDGTIVGEGWHRRFGEPHAEVNALRAAGDRARGATLYVTLEPCAHQGKTPPCADAIAAAGITRCVIATRDPNPVAAGGFDRLRAAGVAVDVGIEGSAARELNAPFFNAFEGDRPWVTLKLAVSLDGAIADAKRSQGWLTGEAARREVHRLRAGSDAIGVGIGTVLADNPMLTVRDADPPRVKPIRVVFDRKVRLPVVSALARSARDVPVLVAAEMADPSRVAPLADAGVDVISAAGMLATLRVLKARGIRSLFVEGGAGITGALLANGCVDRLIIFQVPVVLGAGALNAFAHVPPASADAVARWRLIARRTFGDDVMTIYGDPRSGR